MGYFSSAAARSMARRGGVGKPRAKRPYKRMPSRPATRKKGRTGTKRRSAGRGTMQKHRAPVAVGTSVAHGMRGPGGIGYSMKQVSDTCTRIVGRAYVGEVSSAGKLVTGLKKNALGLVFDVNPSLLNDRVAVIAGTFQKYVYQGMRFTYVPQCPTSVGGSVGLVFDRDPLEISANVQSEQFLSEVMSYEHAVLTPAYVEASTAYTRDPKELKTWYLGAPDATLTTRETSQGNLLVYMSNVNADQAYGFIVMDYVLDLIAPSLMPNKQNITAYHSAPSQWVDCGASAAFAVSTDIQTTVAGVQAYAFYPQPDWFTKFDAAAIRPGAVGEIHLGNQCSDVGTKGGIFNITNGTAALAVAADGTTIASTSKSLLKFGQKLYFCIHEQNPATGGTGQLFVTWHTTLSSARASASMWQGGLGVIRPNIAPDCIYAVLGTGGAWGATVSGWARLIAEGAASEDNA